MVGGMSWAPGPRGIEPAAWRVLTVFRALALGYAVVLFVVGRDDYRHPAGGWLLLAVMAGWTALVSVVYRRPAGRTWAWVGADLAVAVAAVLVSRLLDSPAHIAAGSPTLPVLWSAAPVLAWALRGGWLSGVVAALAVGVADVVHRQGLSQTTVTNIVLLVLGGALVGYVVPLARSGEVALARAEAAQAATLERERLSRDIHDSVLQVLALIHRRGREIGGAATDLGRLAGEQERALRRLVSGTVSRAVSETGTPSTGTGDETDLVGALAAFQGEAVTVSGPGGLVLLPAVWTDALVAATAEALRNVERHAGPHARAWVLVDDDGGTVSVLVRDDGPGIAADRLAEAERDGRLGVAGSIIGRLRAIGGTASVTSSPGDGTEVELRVVRPAAHTVGVAR